MSARKASQPGWLLLPAFRRPELCTAAVNCWLDVYPFSCSFWLMLLLRAWSPCHWAKGVGGHCPCWCPHQADRRSPRGGPGRQHFWVLSSPDCIGRTHTRVAHVSVVPAPQAGEGLGLRPVVSRSAEASGSVWASPGSFPPSPRFLGQRSEPQSPRQRTETRPGPHHPPPCGPGGACASRHRPAGVVMEFCFL